MPVDELLVEGNLDEELLVPVLAGHPVVQARGPKTILPIVARSLRRHDGRATAYLRDRDFDHFPPAPSDAPHVDSHEDGSVLGWRWSRHEIENYLLEPRIVAAAVGCSETEYRAALVSAANRIRHYQVARWAVGICRSGVPRPYELETIPAEARDKDFWLPDDLSERHNAEWARTHIAAFGRRCHECLAEDRARDAIDRVTHGLDASAIETSDGALLWCSGKDLLAALSEWANAKGFGGPGPISASVRDWIRENPEQALDALPEWRSLRDHLRQ